MISSSSTFCPNPGYVIRDLFRLLLVVWQCMEALVYSDHPREAAAFTRLAIIFRQIPCVVPWLLRSAAVPLNTYRFIFVCFDLCCRRIIYALVDVSYRHRNARITDWWIPDKFSVAEV